MQVGDFKRDSGYRRTQHLLSLDSPPAALFAANNVLGEASLFAIRERGLRIPQDVSFIIFDEVPWASLTSPRVSVIAQPAYRLGFLSMERLVKRLEEDIDTAPPPTRDVLQPELVIRESCATCKRPRFVP